MHCQLLKPGQINTITGIQQTRHNTQFITDAVKPELRHCCFTASQKQQVTSNVSEEKRSLFLLPKVNKYIFSLYIGFMHTEKSDRFSKIGRVRFSENQK